MGIRGTVFAIQAGLCAAMASVSAKLAVSSDASSAALGLGAWLLTPGDTTSDSALVLQYQLVTVMRIIGVGGIIFFNVLMWVLFTKSMHLCSSTLEATIFNTASNFFFTAVVGHLLFGENLGTRWWVGSTLLITGLAVLHYESQRQESEEKLDTDKTANHPGTRSDHQLSHSQSKKTKVS